MMWLDYIIPHAEPENQNNPYYAFVPQLGNFNEKLRIEL